MCGDRLRAVDEHGNAARVRQLATIVVDRIDRAERVRDVRDRDDPRACG